MGHWPAIRVVTAAALAVVVTASCSTDVQVAGTGSAETSGSGTPTAAPTTRAASTTANRSAPAEPQGVAEFDLPIRGLVGSPLRRAHCTLSGQLRGAVTVTARPPGPGETGPTPVTVLLPGGSLGELLDLSATVDCGKGPLRGQTAPNPASGDISLDLVRSFTLRAGGRTVGAVRGDTLKCTIGFYSLYCPRILAGDGSLAVGFQVTGPVGPVTLVFTPTFTVKGKVLDFRLGYEVPLTRWTRTSGPVGIRLVLH